MPLSRSSHGRIVTAILLGALSVVAGCNAILGLDEKERAVADGSDADPTDAPSSTGDAADLLDGAERDGATSDPEGDCGALDAGVTFYASCVPHVTSASVCNEYGTTDGLHVSADGLATQKSACSKLKGTWSDGPCDRTGAVFGCRTGDPDAACTTLSISWYYPPVTTAYIDSGLCSPSIGTVVFP